MRCVLFLTTLLIFAIATASAGDPVIETARSMLSTARQEALLLLEEAVLQSPQRTDYWIELLRALETDSASDFTLRCYAQAALKLNPNSLELYWEWIRLLPTAPALDEFALLEKREPNRKFVADMRSVLQHGLKPPRDWQEPKFYEEWAGRLVHRADWQPAADIVARGLALNPKSELLQTMEVMVLIGQEKYPAALEAAQKAKYRQSVGENLFSGGRYPSVGDLLMLHKQPKLAVQSFGPEPENAIQSRDALILGQALLLAGEVDRAEHVFDKAEEVGANLLVIANLLDLKKEVDARAVAEKWMESWQSNRQDPNRRHNTALDCAGLYPISLQIHLRKAVAWLYQTYPKRHAQLKAELPEPNKTLPFEWPPKSSLAYSATTWLKREQDGLAALLKLPPKELDQKQLSEINRMLFNQVYPSQISGKYREAAELMRLQCEYLPYYKEMPKAAAIYFAARRQDFMRRAAAAEFYLDQPQELFHARRALTLLKPTPGNIPKNASEELKNGEQAVAEISRLNPHCLTLVYEKLDTNTKGQDLTPYVQMIAQRGALLDSSALLQLLGVVNTFQKPDHFRLRRNVEQPNKNDELTVAAINAALTKISGGKLAPEEHEDSFVFWEAWWQENVVRVLAETN